MTSSTDQDAVRLAGMVIADAVMGRLPSAYHLYSDLNREQLEALTNALVAILSVELPTLTGDRGIAAARAMSWARDRSH